MKYWNQKWMEVIGRAARKEKGAAVLFRKDTKLIQRKWKNTIAILKLQIKQILENKKAGFLYIVLHVIGYIFSGNSDVDDTALYVILF